MVPVDEPIQSEDFVVCKVTSRFDGKVISEDEELTLQALPMLSLSDATVEGFDKLMRGARAGDKRTAQVEISPFADQEELQGKTVELEFEVLDVKRVESVSANQMAEKFGMPSADDLRRAVKDSLEERLKYAQRERVRDQISKMLTESADWELPPDLLRRQSRRELERAVIEMRSSGFSEQEIKVRENGLRKNVLEKTAVLLKEHFILERIAEEEKIEDEPRDYELEIARIAVQRNDSPRRVRARLERTGQIDALRNMIIERKVIDLITEHARFKSTPYEFMKKETTSAVTFFAAGRVSSEIPQAKYSDNQAEPLPGVKERD
jgi:trigger factor